MPLVLFVGVDCNGLSRIVAFALTSFETKQCYDWIIKTFHEIMFEISPKVVFTDEDESLTFGNFIIHKSII